ncbi:MAG: hypothetical protein F6K42_13135 [Leptolyngbya sp. SIO1D8]|nr:hypothetical protein [Leptolyngbya sp. SIO1D8]
MTDTVLDKAFFYLGLICIGFGVICIGLALSVSSKRTFRYQFDDGAVQQRSEITQKLIK